MNELALTDRLLALDSTDELLGWRRCLCLQQWAIDDCGACPVQTDETPPEFRIGVLFGGSYAEAVSTAMACWRWVGATMGEELQAELGAGILDELAAMTPNESSEPNDYRWVAPPLDSRAGAHVGHICGTDWGFVCDRSSARRNYSDRTRGGLIPCPICVAHLSNGLSSDHLVMRSRSERLLSQIGWKLGDPLPIIWRIVEREASWASSRRYPQARTLQELYPDYVTTGKMTPL